mgnify:FL=1
MSNNEKSKPTSKPGIAIKPKTQAKPGIAIKPKTS